jgi:hypothetical protein
MIELFDGRRLLPKKDHTLLFASAALLLSLGLLGVHGATLHHQLQLTANQALTLKTLASHQKAADAGAKVASPELLADLRRQAEKLEADVSPTATNAASRMPPSQWLAALGELSTNEVGVVKADVSRDGSAVLEGQAMNPRAVTGYMGAWEKHPSFVHLQAKALELREDRERPGLLRFVLRTVPSESVPGLPRAASGGRP